MHILLRPTGGEDWVGDGSARYEMSGGEDWVGDGSAGSEMSGGEDLDSEIGDGSAGSDSDTQSISMPVQQNQNKRDVMIGGRVFVPATVRYCRFWLLSALKALANIYRFR